ncbi:MAG: DUF3108 domain-containing protein [Ottowia sp.]|nr:DUF3108 domain-containing protein [Ottowia sp.]
MSSTQPRPLLTVSLLPKQVTQTTPRPHRPPVLAPQKPQRLATPATPPIPPSPTVTPDILHTPTVSDTHISIHNSVANDIDTTADIASPTPIDPSHAAIFTPEPEPTFAPPPSARSTYISTVNGLRNQDGNILWTTEGLHYQLSIEIPLPFFGPFRYESTGEIDTYGLAPIRYAESRGKHAAITTQFHRDAEQTIHFSRTPTTLPLKPGTQDRFSVLWQLVALVRAMPTRYTEGVTQHFSVADTDQVEDWAIQAQAEEDVALPQGHIIARHFLRLPRRADDARKLEVWLAKDLGWIPVKIRQTEPNGNVIELIFKSSTPL